MKLLSAHRASVMTAALAMALVFTTSHAVADDDAAQVLAGERVYNSNCATCHGDGLVNSGTSTFDLRRLRADEHARFQNSVLNGKGQMPPWRGVLTDAQVDSLWHYIRANAPATPTP